jgi:hypothetical protein
MKHNPSHTIHDLRFGPNIDETRLKSSDEWVNPLKNIKKETSDGYSGI